LNWRKLNPSIFPYQEEEQGDLKDGEKTTSPVQFYGLTAEQQLSLMKQQKW